MKTNNEIQGGNPFKVPENYFEEVNHKIIAATADKEREPGKTGMYRRLRPFLAVAASVALLAILTYSATIIFRHVNRNSNIPEISMEEFSSSYLKDIDIQTLETGADPGMLTDNMPVISNPEIIDYLLSENIDLNDIYELL